jgi:ankyrin repeat protein
MSLFAKLFEREPASDLVGSAGRGKIDKVRQLLSQGIDIDSRNKDGATALLKAAGNGHLDVVGELIQGGADVNATDQQGLTPLMLASAVGYVEIARLLVERGADVNARTFQGKGHSALDFAKADHRKKVIELLLEHGAREVK